MESIRDKFDKGYLKKFFMDKKNFSLNLSLNEIVGSEKIIRALLDNANQ